MLKVVGDEREVVVESHGGYGDIGGSQSGAFAAAAALELSG